MNGVDPRIEERRSAVERAAARRRAILLAVGAGVVATLALTWFVLQSSLLEVRVLHVEGLGDAEAALVARRADLPVGESLPLLDTEPIAARVRRIPWVAEVSVTKHLPHAVTIRVVARPPIAFARPLVAPTRPTGTSRSAPGPSGADAVTGASGTTVPPTSTTTAAPVLPPRLVDATGRVLATTAAPPDGLPEIVGARVPAAGRRIRPAGAATALASLPAELRDQVATLTVDARSGLTLGLRIPPGTRRPPARRIRLGSAARARAKGEAALAVLRSIVASKGAVTTIDVSVPAAPTTSG